MCMKVKRKWRDSCGNDVQCPKLRPTCAPIKTYGTPYCRGFGNDAVLINLYNTQHGFYRISRLKLINILETL